MQTLIALSLIGLKALLAFGEVGFGLDEDWRLQHAVTGLPTIDGSQPTSYSGLVRVRKDGDTEVKSTRQHQADSRADCFIGFSKLRSLKTTIRLSCYGYKVP
jgi:hypothetical protein